MTLPQYILGSGHFAVIWLNEEVALVAEALQETGISRIGSAARCPNTSPGDAKSVLGQNHYVNQGFRVDTKAAWLSNGRGFLTEEVIEKSLIAGFRRLGTEKVNIVYCHGPDRSTLIVKQAAAVDAQYNKGHFSFLPVGNFTTELLEEWLHLAEEKSYIKPSVFKGQRNLFCRSLETSLFPLLNKHGISFVAYSPLAGGFLTGKLTFAVGNEDLKGTRFEIAEGNYAGIGYRHWHDKTSMHEAMRKMAAACEPHGISTADAATRWLLYHAPLPGQTGNGVIVGPSNVTQLGKYATARNQGALPAALVQELDSLWDTVKDEAGSIVVF